MACAINTDDASGLNAERLALVQKLIQGKEFVEQVYQIYLLLRDSTKIGAQ
jgi:hydrogenase large subunit